MNATGVDALPGYVCFAGQDWWYHNQAHSDFQLMRHVAEQRTVLVVNSVGLRMPVPGRSSDALAKIKRKLASVMRGVRAPLPELPHFHVFTPLVLPLYGSASARNLNARLIRLQVSTVMSRLGLHRPVAVVTLPTAWDAVSLMDFSTVVYNRSDKHSAFAEGDSTLLAALEADLLCNAADVLYVSHELMLEERSVVGDRGHLLDHGIDVDHFRRRDDVPADLAAIPSPRVGFIGGLDDFTVDFDLLERLAVELPDVSLVLIGPGSGGLERFDGLPNVHSLGSRPYADVPRYASGLDVAIMPWLDNEWIRHCNPLKLKEYLAMGLPVVTTDFPELRRYDGMVHVAADAADFVAQVRAELDGTAQPLQPWSDTGSESWRAKARELMDIAEGRESTEDPVGSARQRCRDLGRGVT